MVERQEGIGARLTRRFGQGASPPPVEARPGSAEHVRDTFARLRIAMAQSRAADLGGHSLLARVDHLLGASAHLRGQAWGAREQLRVSIGAYVCRLRAEEVPPERMLISVKALVRDAMPHELDAGDAHDLMEDAVRWSIVAYYQGAR